ncbi:MAG: TonB-dependent receptor [Acidobacteriota bacterium]|nr:TonB-dependent receptor [Acidobacteriota bacterium]
MKNHSMQLEVTRLNSGLRGFCVSFILLFTGSFFGSLPAYAANSETEYDLIGVVKDESGKSVAQASVSLLNVRQALVASTRTDEQGQFKLASIAAGTYELLVSSKGFESRRRAVSLPRDSVSPLEIKLGLPLLVAEVTVTAETGSVQDKDQVVQQVNVITEDNIAQRATAVLAQVADEEVGISLQRTSPTIGSVLVRGLTEVGVFVDGVRYTNSTQRGGINTFFNLNDPSNLRSVEVLRGPNTAQYGSDSLGGTAQLLTRQPQFGFAKPETHGELNTYFTSADLSFGSNALLTYGTERFGVLTNLIGRRVNTLRPGGGIDSHSAITRFLGLPSDILGTRLTDTAFTQFGGSFKLAYAPTNDQQFTLNYQRSQQDGGKRYDQTLGGDGNLIAELRNLMLDFLYGRYSKQGVGFFDNFMTTISYNSQREERVNQGGNGNPAAAITHDKERTSSYGFSFSLDKQSWNRNSFLFGGDIYYDKVNAPSFSVDPLTNAVALVRPRVPNGSRYILAGLFAQDGHELIRNHLRVSGALRYNVGSYRARAEDAPRVNGQPLFPNDSLRVGDFSGRIGVVGTLAKGLSLAFNFSRGFRAPNITSLGSTGLVGVGYQVATSDVLGLNATLGSTADDRAVNTNIAVEPLKSETSNNYEFSLRFRNSRIDTDLTGFIIDYANTIVRQTLILPQGAVGKVLGSQTIERQNANGAVFVPLSTSPVLVQANLGGTRLQGVEYTLNFRITNAWSFGGNYSYVYAEDRATGAPPNLGGGGIPPQMGFLRLRYQPAKSNYWIEAYTNLAGRQDRLSTLDLADRRTGATRSRAAIQNFFRRGACVRGITTPGTNGQCNSAGGTLKVTGETLAQVQTRLLGTMDSAPLFTAIPGYGLVNLRGGFRFDDRSKISIDLENIADKSHRAPGWGVDGPGISLTVRYQYQF